MSAESAKHSYPIPRTLPYEPSPVYAELRKDEPVCPVSLATGDPAFMVSRYEDVKAVLSDPRLSREELFRPGASRAQVGIPDPDSILNLDPPRQTKLRQMVTREFSPRRVEGMRPYIQRLVDELLDDMGKREGEVDLNDAFFQPLALRIICELLGVPFEDHHRFGEWCDHFMSLTKYTPQEIGKANADMRGYFVDLVAAKRQNPGEDLLSALVRKHDEEERLTEAELVSLGVVLLLAGHDTTVTVLGGSVVTLLRHPDQLEKLRADPSLYAGAIEELVRLNEPGDGSFVRIATSDVEIGGRTIPAGGAVIASISSANRDSRVFDDPDGFHPQRPENPHIAFGHGPHFCIGSQLARAELEIGLRSLFERFPTLQLTVAPQELRWKDYAALGGWERVPVTW
ncbi:cytochrome P450 [Streptomyces sp. NPDC051219]|uniref:cytochrome P450 n=1 Tax=Streptomyces sp. NPDC051219 TaxID=3155283 RepID=UPI00342CFF6E